MVIAGLKKEKVEAVNDRLKALFGNYPTAKKALVVADGNVYMEHENETALKHAKDIKQSGFATINKGTDAEFDPATQSAPVEPIAPPPPPRSEEKKA